MKPYTCFFAAHGCCRSANSKGNSPLSGGHRGSGSTAVKKQPCPPLFYFLLYGTNLHRRGGTISYRMPPFSFLFFPRLLLTTSARLAPLSRTTPPALKALSSPFQKWAEPASCFRFVFFLLLLNDAAASCAKWPLFFFHSAATVRRELPLIGSACSHGNGRGSISVPRGRTQWACVCV